MPLLTTTSGGITGQYQKYFSKKLLPHAVQLLVLAQFGQKVPFPREQGAVTIRFTRGDVAAAANVLAGGEGIPTTTFRDYNYTFIDATLVEYEIAAKISDVLSWTNLFDTLKNMTGVMGEDVALHADSKIRDTIVAGVTGAGNRRYVGATQTFAGLAALTGGVPSATGAITINDLLDAMTRLTITRAPFLNGEYVACAGPQVCRDILADPKVLLAGQYGTSKALLTGEVGRWYGVRVVKHTNPFIEDGTGSEGTFAVPASAANAIYRTFVMGTDGFGIPQMGGLSPFNPQMMICDKPDKSDPTNRFITAGLKTYWVAVVLNNQWIVSVSSKSVYAG
jgi:N4-gp56 family major capsid protein